MKITKTKESEQAKISISEFLAFKTLRLESRCETKTRKKKFMNKNIILKGTDIVTLTEKRLVIIFWVT